MSKVTVTAAGKAALYGMIKLTSDTIELRNGSFGKAWTMQATYEGHPPEDNEGWTPFTPEVNLEEALAKGYVELVEGESNE